MRSARFAINRSFKFLTRLSTTPGVDFSLNDRGRRSAFYSGRAMTMCFSDRANGWPDRECGHSIEMREVDLSQMDTNLREQCSLVVMPVQYWTVEPGALRATLLVSQ